MLIDKKTIKSISFILENCESVKVPITNFEVLKIFLADEKCEIEAKIVDINISNSMYNSMSALQRLNYYNDITSITVEFVDGVKKNYKVIWSSADYNNENNLYQKSVLLNDKELNLSVVKSNVKDDSCICSKSYENEFGEYISKDINNNWILKSPYEVEDISGYAYTLINFCPFCGKQLD